MMEGLVGADPSADDAVADQLRRALEGHYFIDKEIGRGGMAIVYRARDLHLQREVAIKVMRPEVSHMAGADRFVKEIRFASQLQHPHIVSVYEAGKAESVLYYVMPYVEGESLRDRLRRDAQLPIPDALQIARDVAGALHHAHTRGIVHRDIKPENILLTSGHAMVADFGIASALGEAASDRLTATGMTIGTAAYMSPEQGAGDRHLDGRTDIYALGCVLFEMLAGEPPFTGLNRQAVIARHMHDRPPSLAVVRPTIPRGLEELIETALAKVAADRFRTAAELSDALAAIQQSAPYRARRTRIAAREWIAGAAVLAIAATVSLLVMNRSGVPLDANKLVVFPLAERGLAPNDSGAGYNVALMLGAALEHTEPLKWIDGRQHLDERQRDDPSTLTHRMTRALVRERGARYYLDGVIHGGADSSALTLRLHDALGDSVIAQETATGRVDSVPSYQLGLTAVSRLLARLLAPERRIDFSPLSDRRPSAVALWMQGEREYRGARFLPALRFYQRAVAEDSALAFAAVKGALAANWIRYLPDTRELLAAALRREVLLPQRYRDFARGLEAYLDGRADTAVALFERALASAPQWEEALMALGDAFYHLLPERAPLDSLAESAFEAALAADSAFTPPILHLAEIAIRRGELGRSRLLLSRLRRTDADTAERRLLELMLGCVERGSQRFDWRVSSGNVVALLTAANGLSAAGAQAACAEAGFRAILSLPDATAGQRWSALLGLQGLLAASGRLSDLTTLLDSAAASGTSQALWLYVIDAEAGLAVHRKAAEMEVAARQRFGDGYRGASPHVQWLLGTWHARLGDTRQVEALRSALATRRGEPGARTATLLAQALAAQLAFAARDTSEAIARLRALRPTGSSDTLQWSLWEPLAVERLKLARLLLARGDYNEALRVAAAFDHPQPIAFLPFVPASLAVRYSAAQALGRRDLVMQYRTRLNRLGRADLAAAKGILP